MNDTYKKALNGTLVSDQSHNQTRVNAPVTVNSEIFNATPIPILVKHVSAAGSYDASFTVDPNTSKTFNSVTLPVPFMATDQYVVFSKDTGAFMTVIDPSSTPHTSTGSNPVVNVYHVRTSMLVHLGDIGPIPVPTSSIQIPQDSEHVVVGCSKFNDSTYIIREQYWKRVSDSYSLAPGEQRMVSTTVSYGKQTTSSSETSFTSSLGLSAGVGWGPISASLSANLSSTSRNFQQVVVNDLSTMYLSSTITNTDNFVKMYVHWQLTDVITIVKDKKVTAVLISGEAPVLTRKYNQQTLAAV